MTVTIGKPVEEFSAKTTNNKSISLKKLRGSNFVLYFYPKDNTPGCTSEGLSFAEHHDAFMAADTLIFGVSMDSLASHKKFRTQHAFPFDLVCDENGALCELFDVIRLKRKGDEEFMGIERSTFLIDKNGLLQHEWRRVKIKHHVDDVLQAAHALASAAREPMKEPTKEVVEEIEKEVEVVEKEVEVEVEVEKEKVVEEKKEED